MFRPMRRASRAIPEEAAKHLLQQSRRGVLAVNGDNGYPFAIPVNYYYDQEHDKWPPRWPNRCRCPKRTAHGW